VNQVKQYLVMKMVEGLNHISGFMALPGMYTLEAAQEFIRNAVAAEPDSNFIIQEVGAA
jgi:hypothetical protein